MNPAVRLKMLRLSRGQRRVLVDKMPDVAHLAAGALFFGQFLTDRPFSIVIAFTGLALWAVMMVGTLILAAEDQA
jgi:hypothetical protein